MEMDFKIELILVSKLLIAVILGGIIGIEREIHGNSAGIRTYASVTLGAALFTLIGIHSTDLTAASRIVANIVTGIGFIGAGIIYKDGVKGLTHGLTSAATLWATAAIGVAVAYSMFVIAVVSTVVIYFLLAMHHFKWYISLKAKWKHNDHENDEI
ncbi:MAG: MgtC/SapB family protein [Nitrosarchaeum sp.]|nr:MgtC/SapB family protein [Nitrosarchaeum sp.]